MLTAIFCIKVRSLALHNKKIKARRNQTYWQKSSFNTLSPKLEEGTCLSFQYLLASITEMLAHCKELMEYKNGLVPINPRFNKLITALRTAVEKGEGSLDKEMTSYDDYFDSFRIRY